MTAILNVKKSLICSLHTSHSDPDSDWNMPKSQKQSEKHHKSSKSQKYSSISPTKLWRNTRTRTTFHCTGSTTSCRRAASRFGLARAWAEVRSWWWWWWWWLVYVGILCILNLFEIDVYFVMLLANLIWSDLTSRICLGQFGGLDDVFATVDFTFCVSTEPRFGGASGHSAGGWSKETWRRLADRLTMMEISFLSLKYVENDCFGSDSPTSSSDHQDYLRICTYHHCEFSLFSLNGSGSTLKARLMHWKEWFLIGKGKVPLQSSTLWGLK